MTAHIQMATAEWSTRSPDQRFVSLPALAAYTGHMKETSREVQTSTRKFTFQPKDGDPINGLELVSSNGHAYKPTHWAMSQLAGFADAPAAYMRKLPAALAADCLNYGLMKQAPEDVQLLLRKNGESIVAAATGPKYGRVWNHDVAHELAMRFTNSDWTVPGEFGVAVKRVTKENTTLYAGDRDMFVFLSDEKNKLEIPNRRNSKTGTASRGFYTWNSEVGSGTLGVGTFLFDDACMNRTIFGGSDFKALTIRHTQSAPHRFIEQLLPVLDQMHKASVKPIEDGIKAAQASKVDDIVKFLAERRFGNKQISSIVMAHNIEENRPIETLWDASVAITAYAKSIPFIDERTMVEREAGKILQLVAA